MKHEGVSTYRLHPDANNPREVALAKAWKEQNERGHTLQWLIGDNHSQRDATVAATIIQWLGSNVGAAFLRDVIKDCPELKEALK